MKLPIIKSKGPWKKGKKQEAATNSIPLAVSISPDFELLDFNDQFKSKIKNLAQNLKGVTTKVEIGLDSEANPIVKFRPNDKAREIIKEAISNSGFHITGTFQNQSMAFTTYTEKPEDFRVWYQIN